MRKIIFCVIVFVVFVIGNFFVCFSQDTDVLGEYFENSEFTDVDRVFQNSEYGGDFDIKKTAEDFIYGNAELSAKGIIEYFFKMIFKEIYENIDIIRNVIIICILSALISNFTQTLQNKETGELGFYITYIVMVIILFSSFSLCISIMRDTVGEISELMKASVPVIIGVLVMSGGTSGAYLFSSVIFSASEFIVLFIENFAIPLLIAGSVTQIVNYLSEREILSKFSELIRSCVSWGVKGCAIIFMGILSFQRIGGSAANAAFNKTAKFAVNMIPVVGDVFSGTIDSFMAFSGAVKTGVGIAFIIGIIILCAVPVIKIIAIIIIYKFAASVVQPICDKRIVNCIDDISKYAGIALSVIIMSSVVFIFSSVMIISVSGG